MCAPVFMMATLYGHSVTGSAGITSHNGHCQQNITLYRPHTHSIGQNYIFIETISFLFLFPMKSIDRSQIFVFLSHFIVTLKEIATPGVL